jgi:hypothetical protein
MMMSAIKLSGDLKSWSDTTRKSKGEVLAMVERSLISTPEVRSGAEFVHPSEVAKADWCERATYNRILTGVWPKESFNLIRENIFAEGDFIHEKWQKWMAGTGDLWGVWECQYGCGYAGTETSGGLPPDCPYCAPHSSCCMEEGVHEPECDDKKPRPWENWKYKEVPLEHGIITGHEDGAMGTHLVEIKSVGVGTLRTENKEINPKCCGWKNWQELKMPMISHQIQGQLYLWLAQQMNLTFDSLAIIYEFKPNQQVREFDLPLNMRLLQPILARIDTIKYALGGGEPPACPYGGCKYCDPKDKKDSTKVRQTRGRASEGTVGTNRSRRKRSDAVDGTASVVGELHRPGTSGSGDSRKVRRRHS